MRFKAFLLILFPGILVILLLLWSSNLSPRVQIPISPVNQYIIKINNDIDDFNKSENSFFENKEHLQSILSRLEYFASRRLFANDQSTNLRKRNKYREALLKLYKNKTDSLIHNVLSGSTWFSYDLSLIEDEIYFINKKSPFGQDYPFNTMEYQNSIDLYREIDGFCKEVRDYEVNNYSISHKFPLYKANNFIIDAKYYLTKLTDDKYVRNCSELKETLINTEKYMKDEQIRYIKTKVNTHTGTYYNYYYYTSYYYSIINPIEVELNSIFNNILNNTEYSKDYLDYDYNFIINQLETDSDKAYQYLK